jgi:quinol monooxygenase YgiN
MSPGTTVTAPDVRVYLGACVTVTLVKQMVYMFGKASVAEFDEWKTNFEDNDPYRAEHGQRGFQVFQSVDDPNEVVVVFEWDDEGNARELFDSEEMRGRLTDAGVKGRPEMSFFERVDHAP